MTDQEKNIVKVDDETASNEFERWTECMGIDLENVYDENERRDVEEDRAVITKWIMDGKCIINDDGLLIYTAVTGEEFTFYRLRADAIVSMDKKKKHAEVGKMVLSIAQTTRTSEKMISKLYSQDFMALTRIWSLFLI
jgi:hypothetical protein